MQIQIFITVPFTDVTGFKETFLPAFTIVNLIKEMILLLNDIKFILTTIHFNFNCLVFGSFSLISKRF